MALVPVGKVEDFPKGKMRAFSVGGRDIAVVAIDERFYAFANRCTHLEQFLTDGFIEGRSVICAYHEATYDLDSGAVLFGPAFDDLAVFPVRLTDGRVEVEWPEEVPADLVFPVEHSDEERYQRQLMMM